MGTDPGNRDAVAADGAANAVLDALGDTCELLGRRSFFVTLSPIRISGGTGEPVNPQAIF